MKLLYLKTSFYEPAESHERHGKNSCGNQCYGCALKCFGNPGKFKALPETGKQKKRQTESNASSNSKNCRIQNSAVGGRVDFGGSQYCTVGCDERKINAECSIKGRTEFFQKNFYNLHKAVADDGRIIPILFCNYAVYATRGLLTELQPARDNVFFYTLGRTDEDAQIPIDYSDDDVG